MDKVSRSTFGMIICLTAAVCACAATITTGGPPEEVPPEPIRAELGKPAPDFELKDVNGQTVQLNSYKGKIVVLEWFHPNCPFVKTAHTRDFSLKKKADEYVDSGIVWLAIHSSESDAAEWTKKVTEARDAFGISYPLLRDEGGSVGKIYGASKTPELFIIDKEGLLAYQGAIDNTSGGDLDDADPPPAINFVDHALQRLLANEPVVIRQTTPWG